jgi:S1-C subfamily serine protease
MSRLSSSRKPAGFSKGGNLAASFKGVAVALILSASSERVWAQEPSASAISPEVKELKEVKEIFDRAKKAVVKIHGVDEHSEIFGTGFFVDPTGTLYTSYTVGGEAGNFTIDFGGKEYPARQVLVDVRSGMAILKIDAVTPALPIGKSEQLEVATPVIAIGYPLDLRETPSFGMIAGFDRKYLGRYFSTTHLRVNVAAQRGEAGAPLLNFKGEVVGILVSSLENNSSCYALPIDAAEKIRSDFVRFGEVRHGWIGANVSDAKEAIEGSRAKVTEILDSPAADAGIKPGDVLLQVGRTKVKEPEDVLDASFFLTAGDTVPITVLRDGEKVTFNVQADVHPASKNLPLYPDGRRVPMSATFSPNRAIPLNLESAPQRTP